MRCSLIAEVDILPFVDVRRARPVAPVGPVDLPATYLVFNHGEGSGAVGAYLVHAAAFGVQNHQRIVKEAFRDSELRCLPVKANREVVDLLDRTRVPKARRGRRRACAVLLTTVVFLEQGPLNQGEPRGAGLGGAAALQVPEPGIGRELPATVPLHIAAQVQGPALKIPRRLPFGAQPRT